MPRMRRMAKSRRTELTHDQFFELLLGPGGRGISDFESVFTARVAWFENRDELMADPVPGMRPHGWWLFEGGGQRPEDEAAELRRMGKLEDWEKAQLEAMEALSGKGRQRARHHG